MIYDRRFADTLDRWITNRCTCGYDFCIICGGPWYRDGTRMLETRCHAVFGDAHKHRLRIPPEVQERLDEKMRNPEVVRTLEPICPYDSCFVRVYVVQGGLKLTEIYPSAQQYQDEDATGILCHHEERFLYKLRIRREPVQGAMCLSAKCHVCAREFREFLLECTRCQTLMCLRCRDFLCATRQLEEVAEVPEKRKRDAGETSEAEEEEGESRKRVRLE